MDYLIKNEHGRIVGCSHPSVETILEYGSFKDGILTPVRNIRILFKDSKTFTDIGDGAAEDLLNDYLSCIGKIENINKCGWAIDVDRGTSEELKILKQLLDKFEPCRINLYNN